MNMANSNYDEQEFDYSADYSRNAASRRSNSTSASSRRRFQYSRNSRPAVSHNGIHRRRNKRFTW
jgi:hypothetical protein